MISTAVWSIQYKKAYDDFVARYRTMQPKEKPVPNNTPTPHPHAAMIVEWVKDTSRQVQGRPEGVAGMPWADVDGADLWYPRWEYRFAPKMLRYCVAMVYGSGGPRLILCRGGEDDIDSEEPRIDGFLKWVDEIKTVAVPE